MQQANIQNQKLEGLYNFINNVMEHLNYNEAFYSLEKNENNNSVEMTLKVIISAKNVKELFETVLDSYDVKIDIVEPKFIFSL